MTSPRIVVPLLLTIIGVRGICQDRPKQADTAKVTVMAVNDFGIPLSNVKVDSFVDETDHDWAAALFHSGPIASGVPFGKYRITVHADDFRPSTFYIEAAAPDVLVTAGLEWYGVENIRITAELRGKLIGFPSTWNDWWCKASGVYSRLEYESAVKPADLSFNFGEVPPGLWVVACVANRKFIAVRTIRIAADAVPFTIEYRSKEDGEAVQH